MKKKTSSEFWIPDVDTYNHLQKLKKFVDFVAGLEYSTSEDKTKVEEIKLLIENIDKPESFKEWCVSIDIYDWEVQGGHGKGIYWRGWCVWFELGMLEIEAFYHILDENRYTDDYSSYYDYINFNKEIKGERVYMDTDLNEFIEDAMNYKSYITETLNEIEVEIDIWNKVKHQPESGSDELVKYRVRIDLGNNDNCEP
jgi:hypothetical protein